MQCHCVQLSNRMASACSRVAAAMVLNGPPDFLKYLCVVCKFILKDAVQTSCGHWLCQECAEDVFRAAASRLRYVSDVSMQWRVDK